MTRLAIVFVMSIGLVGTFSCDTRAQTPPLHGTITMDSSGASPHFKTFRRASTPGNVYIQVHRYKGRYVLYVPCDGGARPEFTLTSRAIYEYFADGPSKTALRKISSMPRYMMYTTGVPGDTLKIHHLDGGHGLTVGEWLSGRNGVHTHILLTPAKSLEVYPVVQLHCINERLTELTFDPIDFDALLKRK